MGMRDGGWEIVEMAAKGTRTRAGHSQYERVVFRCICSHDSILLVWIQFIQKNIMEVTIARKARFEFGHFHAVKLWWHQCNYSVSNASVKMNSMATTFRFAITITITITILKQCRQFVSDPSK